MGHEHAGAKLRELAGHPDEHAVRHAARRHPPQRRAGEVADLDEAAFRQVGQQPHRGAFGAPAGREHDGVVVLRGGDVDRLHDRRAPRRGRERPHDAGGPEDRDAADDAETPVRGLARHDLAAGNADGAAQASGGEDLADGGGDHLPRHGVDGRAADGEPEPRLGHRADPVAGDEGDLAAVLAFQTDGQVRTVGHVRVVAGVLDDDRLGRPSVGGQLRAVDREAMTAAVGEADVDRVRRRRAGEQQRRGLRGGRGTRPGGPAAAQRSGAHLRGARQVGFAQVRAARAGFADVGRHGAARRNS